MLIQSVPSGMRSRTWALEIDVKPAMARETQELDVVIEQVQGMYAVSSIHVIERAYA